MSEGEILTIYKPIFLSTMASTTQNISVIINGDIREYSDFIDTVDLSNVTPTNYQTRMLGGDDLVTLSDINLGGFSNQVNGNKGRDTFISKAGSDTRDYIRGGSEDDFIVLAQSTSGGDWQNGNFGRDFITGANSTTMSVLRGGADDDSINIIFGSKHIAVGDLGTDQIFLDGVGRVVLRTDGDNAAQNFDDADGIWGFKDGIDKAFIPGVNSITDLTTTQVGLDTFISADTFTDGTTGTRFIARFVGNTEAEVDAFIAGGDIMIGDSADNALAALTVENFLVDPNLGGIFA